MRNLICKTIFAAALAAALAFAPAARADEEDVWTELAAESTAYKAVYTVKTLSSQASAFTIATDKLAALWMEKVKNAPLVKPVIDAVYAANGCDPDGSVEGEDDYFCGGIDDAEADDFVLWSYGRGGWASAGAGYRFFLPFVSAGSGSFTTMALGVSASIDVDALDMPEDESGAVTFKVTFNFTQLSRYADDGDTIEEVIKLE